MYANFQAYEIVFYGIIVIWGLLRYRVIRNSTSPVPEDYDIPQFDHYKAIVEKEIPYFRDLSLDGKKKFISRLDEIMNDLEFQGREDFAVTEEVKVLISACITQLTFGFNTPKMPMLKGVIVFPGIFYSKLTGAWVKGLTMGNGVVFLSWADFKEGYLYSTSTYNLGLHEFAHMLRLEALNEDFSDQRLNTFFDEWEENGTDAFLRIREGSQDFFREYAGTNRAEFFSVCVENFFEVPAKFEAELPEVYWHLCFLLKQNPMNKMEDYLFDTGDTIVANQEIEDKLPVYEVYPNQFEYQIWNIAGIFWFMGFVLVLFCAHYLQNEAELISWIRMGIVSLMLGLTVRIYSYKSFSSIIDWDYLKHFFIRVLPVTLGISLFYKVVFGL